MPQRNRDYKQRNVVRSVLNEIWAILPEKLDEILELLEARSAGTLIDEQVLQEKFGNSRDADDERIMLDGGIQVIDVFGTLAPRMNLMMRFSGGTSTQKLAAELRTAAADKDVRSVILRVDSPGGAATYTPEAAAAVVELARTKRVVTSATNQMASAAYYIGVGSSEVYASPSTQVGSIGVYTILTNIKDQAEQQGVKFTVLRGGDLKAAGNPYEELTTERQQALQDRVDAIYSDFLVAVAEQRDKTVKAVESTFGQGNVFLAAEAQQRGMIDGVLTFEQVVAQEQDRLHTSAMSVSFGVSQEGNMNPKLKATLFARGLIASMEADEVTCQAAVNSFRALAGITEELTDDQLCEKLLNFKASQNPEASGDDEKPKVKPPQGSKDLTASERSRILDLQARGELLGVSKEDIQAAIDSNMDVGQALIDWTEKLSADKKPIDIAPCDAQADKVARGASAMILKRYRALAEESISDEDLADANGYGASFKNDTVLDMARVQLASIGIRPTGDRMMDARMYLQEADIFGMSGSVNRRGDHPDMLSALTKKMLTQGAVIAETTYQMWCARIEDLPDFKPKSFIDVGVFNQLDAILEDKTIQEMQFQSDIQTWIKADRFANKVGLTVEMIADDDLGGFARQLRSLGMAAENTVQQAALSLLNLNPTMLDGNAFFSAAHSNAILSGSGGVPSSTELIDHRRLHRLQTSFGSNRPMGLNIYGLLAPATLEENVLQTITPNYEVKTPQTDATVNTFRGQVRPVIDANLDGYSAAKWYTFVNPAIASALVYAFQTGYGPQGLREDWYDPNTKNRYVSVETSFGVALSNYRAMVRNFGS